MEQEVARWFKKFGHPAAADQASLSKSLAPTCRGYSQRIWSFLLSNAKEEGEARQIERRVIEYEKRRQAEEQGPSRQQECMLLKEQLSQLNAQAVALERKVAFQEVSMLCSCP
jgi:hypothetical protein